MPKLYFGSRGGMYYRKNGRRVYVKQRQPGRYNRFGRVDEEIKNSNISNYLLVVADKLIDLQNQINYDQTVEYIPDSNRNLKLISHINVTDEYKNREHYYIYHCAFTINYNGADIYNLRDSYVNNKRAKDKYGGDIINQFIDDLGQFIYNLYEDNEFPGIITKDVIEGDGTTYVHKSTYIYD